jgi:hypothetical protein
MTICKRINIRILPIHLLRNDPRIKIADDGSKTADSDDWQVDDETFQRSNTRHGFTIDLFASDRNAKCKRFYSNFHCSETTGIDAFTNSWDGEIAWICPPVKEVTRIVARLRTEKMTCVLFVPEWKTADFWVEIFYGDCGLLWPFIHAAPRRPFIIQGRFDFRSPFSGRSKFDFLELSFDSTRGQ